MTESTQWQRIGQVPVDTGRLVLVDPMNLDDAVDHVGEVIDHEVPESMTYELVTNDYGVAVALVFSTGLGDGLYPVEARFEEAEGLRSDRRDPGPVPAPPVYRLRAAPMMRVCLTWRCPSKIPIVPGRKTPSRCPQCRGRSWANPPPANAYAYGSSWQVIRKKVLERDGYQCQLRYAAICIGRASQVDHIVQPEAGGGSDLENLRAVCVRCHARRTGRQGALAKQRRAAAKKRRK